MHIKGTKPFIAAVGVAALLLISTKMTISEIASAVGFGDPLYFSKRFKHKYKAPPRIYREKVLTQDATL